MSKNSCSKIFQLYGTSLFENYPDSYAIGSRTSVVVLIVEFLTLWNVAWCASLQVSSQTGEDSTGRDVQTDDIVMMNRWVQWPPEDRRGWGCDDDDDNVMNSGHITNTILSDKDAMGLSKFLHSASQVRQSTVNYCNNCA